MIRDLSPVNLFRDLERDTICLFLLALKESLIFKQRSYNYEQSEILIIPLLSTQVNIAGSFYDLFIHYYNSLQEKVLLKRRWVNSDDPRPLLFGIARVHRR